MTFAEKQAMIGKSVPANTTAISAPAAGGTDDSGEYITHTVRNGDTIWDIVSFTEM